MRRYKSKKGITLIELVITLGLIGVITGLAFFFFNSNKRTLDRVKIQSDLQYEAKEVMNKISKCAMEAKSVAYSGISNKVVFSLIPSEDGVDTAEFIVEGGSSSSIDSNTVEFIGDKIFIGTIEICTNLESLTLSGDKEKNLQVDLVLENKGITYSVKDNFLFRNSHKN